MKENGCKVGASQYDENQTHFLPICLCTACLYICTRLQSSVPVHTQWWFLSSSLRCPLLLTQIDRNLMPLSSVGIKNCNNFCTLCLVAGKSRVTITTNTDIQNKLVCVNKWDKKKNINMSHICTTSIAILFVDVGRTLVEGKGDRGGQT